MNLQVKLTSQSYNPDKTKTNDENWYTPTIFLYAHQPGHFVLVSCGEGMVDFTHFLHAYFIGIRHPYEYNNSKGATKHDVCTLIICSKSVTDVIIAATKLN